MTQKNQAKVSVPRIEFETYSLPNGLQVILHEDNKLPVVHVNLWYHVGSKNERPGKTGFAHLFEHMMFEGSRNVKEEYISLMERAGANISQGGVNGTTNFDRTNYFETVPSGALELVLWAESDRMGYLLDAVTQENFDNQRDVVKNERRQTMDNVPYGTAVEVLFQNLFPSGHPYSWHIIGSMEDLEKASLQDVHAFFNKFYTPNNCVLSIAGQFDFQAARDLVEKYFAPLPPGSPLERSERHTISLPSEKRIKVYDRVPQERVYMAWPGVNYFDEDDAALDLLSNLLADGKNSRLYKRLVYDEQVASDVSAFNYSLEIAGFVGVVATARPGESLTRLEALVEEEIRSLSAKGPTLEELSRVKAGQEFGFLSGLERIGGFGGKADRLAMYQTFLGSPDFIERDYARYQKLETRDILEAANRYLLAPRLTVSFCPEKAVLKESKEPKREEVPETKTSPHFEVPRILKARLENGISLRVVERRDVPVVSTALMINAGATAETFDCTGLSSMTVEMLEEGTTTRTSLEIEAEFDRLGSHLSAGGSREWSVVALDALKRHLPISLELMADVVLNPTFPEEELERLRKQRLDNMLQEKVSPTSIAGKALRKCLFGSAHPYGWPVSGIEKSIIEMRRTDLEQFYLDRYTPEDSVLIMVGDIDLEEGQQLAEQAFGDWRKPKTASKNLVEPVKPVSQATYFANRSGAAQSELRIAKLGPPRATDDYYVLEVLTTILGGGFSGRLNLNLREDKGYTYGAFAAIRYSSFQSILVASTSVESSVTRKAIDELLFEFESLSAWSRPITHQELNHAKDSLIRGFAQRFETFSQVAGEIAELDGFGLTKEELNRYCEEVENVSLGELEVVAKKYLGLEDAILVVVGDGDKLETEVSALAFGKLQHVDNCGDLINQ